MLTVLRDRIAAWLTTDELLNHTNFRRYWLASTFTGFGGIVGGLAMSIVAVLVLHASAAQMGTLTACQAIPFALFALPSGVWLDRNRKYPVLLASKALQAVTLSMLPVAYWCGALSMPWLYAVAIVQGTCSIVGGGAEQIFLNFLIGRERLVEAQSRLAATDSITRLIAPGVAGLLVQWLSAPGAILINAFGFCVSLFNLRRVHVEEPAPKASDKHPLHDIREGFRFILRQPVLRTMAWSAACWHLLFYGYMTLGALFTMRDLGMTPGQLGMAEMFGGLGVLASSMLLRPLSGRFGPGIPIIFGTAATAAGYIALPLLPAQLFGSTHGTFAALALITFVSACGLMLYFVPYQALRQKVTPDDMLGRVINTMRFLTVAIAPLGAVAAGFLADRLGTRMGLYGIAAAGTALAIAMAFTKTLRSVRP
jgi:MFS family permease